MSEYEQEIYKGYVDRLKVEVAFLQEEQRIANIITRLNIVACTLNALAIIITNWYR